LERHDRSVVPNRGETQSGDKLTELWRSFSWEIVILAYYLFFIVFIYLIVSLPRCEMWEGLLVSSDQVIQKSLCQKVDKTGNRQVTFYSKGGEMHLVLILRIVESKEMTTFVS